MRISKTLALVKRRMDTRGPLPPLCRQKTKPKAERPLTEAQKIKLLIAAAARWVGTGPHTWKVRFSHDGRRYFSILWIAGLKVYDAQTGRFVTGGLSDRIGQRGVTFIPRKQWERQMEARFARSRA